MRITSGSPVSVFKAGIPGGSGPAGIGGGGGGGGAGGAKPKVLPLLSRIPWADIASTKGAIRAPSSIDVVQLRG